MAAAMPSQAHAPVSSHRLPTQSASEALQELEDNHKKILSSGVDLLDRTLAGDAQSEPIGFERGRVTEIWGPSGSGKTLLTVQAAHEAIKCESTVTWIDAATPLSAPNLKRLKASPRTKATENDSAEAIHVPNAFHYFSVSTLSHLLALLLHPPQSFLPQNTSLFVIDGLSLLLDRDYPRLPFISATRTEQQKWQAGRRYAVLGALVSSLSKLATIYDIAVLVTTGCSTRMRSESGRIAAVAPGVGGAEWEAGVWNRLVLFRDFGGGRFIGVQKRQGRHLRPTDPVGEAGDVVPFEIGIDGIIRGLQIGAQQSTEMQIAVQEARALSSPVKVVRKRAYEEIADSDDEAVDEYGWMDADEDAVVAGVLADEQTTEDVVEENSGVQE